MKAAAVQMALELWQDTSQFAEKIHNWTKKAKQAGADLVVFPEDIGLPLLFVEDYDLASEAETVAELAGAMLDRNWLTRLSALLRTGASAETILLSSKAQKIRDSYFSTFIMAAQDKEITIVGGSIPLPSETPESRGIYNTSYVFNPRGETRGFVRKTELMEIEKQLLKLSSETPDELMVFEAGPAKFGVAICKDAWNEELLRSLAEKGASIIASPQANPAEWTEEEAADNKEGLFRICQELGLFGVQAMAVGQLADLKFEGQSAIIGPADVTEDGSGIIAQAETWDGEELVVGEIPIEEAREESEEEAAEASGGPAGD